MSSGHTDIGPSLYARYLCSRDALGKRARDDRVSCIQVRLDSRAATDSPFLGTGSGKVKGQSDTYLTAGSVFYVCRYGTLDSQRWYVQCSKN